MTIHIEDLRFQTIIGILDFERETPQDVVINIIINYLYEDNFINYADVVEFVETNMIEKKYLLIEDALGSISSELSKKYKQIQSLNIKITKPSIISNCEVSVSNNYIFNG